MGKQLPIWRAAERNQHQNRKSGLSLIFEVAGEMEKVARENTVLLVALPCLFMKVARVQKCNSPQAIPGPRPLMTALGNTVRNSITQGKLKILSLREGEKHEKA